jgi:battenin
MKLRDRCAFTRELSKYMVPLLVVYFAEYAMQSGTWAAIGFPVTDEEARKEFYTWANWTYQAGVFASRSSGKIYRPSLTAVQAMPALQVLLLAFFYAVAYFKILYGYGLMAPCFMAGLLGGCVYVNAFSLISEEVEGRERKELALATASVADSFGIMMADVAGLFIQACLYEKHGIEGAKVQCIY